MRDFFMATMVVLLFAAVMTLLGVASWAVTSTVQTAAEFKMYANQCTDTCARNGLAVSSWTPSKVGIVDNDGICVCGAAAGLWAQDR